MTDIIKTRNLILKHWETYPLLQIQDIFKFLYQSTFGCEHMIIDKEKVIDYIRQEYQSAKTFDKYNTVEELDGNFCRVNLSILNSGLSAKTLGGLFILSSTKNADTKEALINKLDTVKGLINEGLLPFTKEDFEIELRKWEDNGFPAVHHSDIFRNNYKPSYRVISKDYIPFLELFAETDKRMAKGNVRLAVEGSSACGKTTLGKIFKKIYGCTVLHTDDFFLQPSQRTPERLSAPGGNIDYERFLSEVLIPLSRNERIAYRRFNCSEMKIMPPEEIIPESLTVIEGAYSMHPEFEKYYNFSVFIDISPEMQKQRILKRNSPAMAERFFNEWIPLEKLYFNTFSIKKKCDMCISVC